MQLQPKRPPGRNDRKAAAYAPEILRLRTEGYTYETIREALADVGIEVSTSGLRREVRRVRSKAPSCCAVASSQTSIAGAAAMPATVVQSLTPALQPAPASLPSGSGHQIAAAFFETHLGNPLLRSKENP